MNFVRILKFSFLQVQEQLDVLNEKLQERLKQQAEKQRAATEVKARLAEKVAHKVRQIHAFQLIILFKYIYRYIEKDWTAGITPLYIIS